jgi:hypothetical protein
LYKTCVISAVCYGKRFGPKGYGYGQGGGALQSDISYTNGYVALNKFEQVPGPYEAFTI